MLVLLPRADIIFLLACWCCRASRSRNGSATPCNGLARPSVFGGGGCCCWKRSVGASDTQELDPLTLIHSAQTAQVAQGLGFWLLCWAVLFLLDPSPGVHSDRSSLTTHTHPPSFSFLSLCPNSVADERIRRPCTALSHCPRPRARNFQCLSPGSVRTPNPNTPVTIIGKPSPIDDPRPGQGPGCSSSQSLSRTAPHGAAPHDGSHEPQQPQPHPASPLCIHELLFQSRNLDSLLSSRQTYSGTPH